MDLVERWLVGFFLKSHVLAILSRCLCAFLPWNSSWIACCPSVVSAVRRVESRTMLSQHLFDYKSLEKRYVSEWLGLLSSPFLRGFLGMVVLRCWAAALLPSVSGPHSQVAG